MFLNQCINYIQTSCRSTVCILDRLKSTLVCTANIPIRHTFPPYIRRAQYTIYKHCHSSRSQGHTLCRCCWYSSNTPRRSLSMQSTPLPDWNIRLRKVYNLSHCCSFCNLMWGPTYNLCTPRSLAGCKIRSYKATNELRTWVGWRLTRIGLRWK